MAKFDRCDYCANTGILSATLVKNEDLSNKKIDIRLCGNHANGKLAEKNMMRMKESGIPIETITVDVKTLEKQAREKEKEEVLAFEEE